jgi:hypothetical protein
MRDNRILIWSILMKRKSFSMFVVLILAALLFSNLNITPALAGPGASWPYKRTITLSAATPAANYQVRVQITVGNYGNMNATDGRDLRFYDSNDVLLDYWIENWNTAGTSNIWVEVPTTGTTSLTMYYGNGSATAVSNGDNTFIFFDDFSGSSVNTTKWSAYPNPAAITVSGGSVTLFAVGGPSPIGRQLIANTPFAMTDGVMVESVLSSNVYEGVGTRASLSGASSLSGAATLFTADQTVNSRFAVWSNGRDNQYGIHTIHEGDGVDNGDNSSQYIQIWNPGGPNTWGASGYVLGAAFTAGRLEYFVSTSISNNPATQGVSNTNIPAVTMYPLLTAAKTDPTTPDYSFSVNTFRVRRFAIGYSLITGTVGAQTEATPPTVNTFTATSPTNSLNIPITAFTASDNVAVNGYLITTSATPPLPAAAGWTGTAPGTYTVGSAGTYTLYPWARDTAGNVSAVFATPPTVVVDTSAPTVNTFTATSPTSNVNIPITAFTASDNVAVNGYLITTSATPPLPGAAGWTGAAPGTYTVGGTGTYTLYPWARDTAGNVSAVFATPRTVVVAQEVAPGAAGGNGPGGVGYIGAASNLELWLRADRGVYTDAGCSTTRAADGNNVGCWQDQSGNGTNATQGTGTPTYNTNMLNGQPALTFNGSSSSLYLNRVVQDDFTIISLFRTTQSWNSGAPFTHWWTGAGLVEAEWGGYANDFGVSLRSAQMTTGIGAAPSNDVTITSVGTYNNNAGHMVFFHRTRSTGALQQYVDDTSTATGTGSTASLTANSRITIGAQQGALNTFSNFFAGNIPEVILFSANLPDVDRILVENYLSAKYAVPLTANDVYDGDGNTSGNGDFDQDMAGIGQSTTGNRHTQAFSAGIIVVDRSFLKENGDWLTFGHRTASNNKVNTDLPAGWNATLARRWTRHWYFHRSETTTNGGLVDIIFDFSEGNMNGGQPPAGPASNYRLLRRGNAETQFTDIATASAIVGDQVQFLGVDVTLLGSNFTLGTLNDNTSPTAIELNSLSAHGPALWSWLLFGAAGLLLGLAGAFVLRRR